ncbi:MAG: hypothetical protein KL863_27695 [Rhizobium sp.]|nr:hypothetical protein [Rhizobium sp.]
MTGGKGYDWADYYGAYDSVEVDLKGGYSAGYDGRDTLIKIDNIRGSRHDDVLAGDDKDNRIRGMQGDDLIDGRGGYDLADYRNASGGVVVNLELGRASGADGNDALRNMEGIRGSSHNDILTGDENDNFFESFGGDDEMTGGAGSDRFSFSNGSGRDTITDFDASGSNPDIIELYIDTITGFKDLFNNHMAQVGDNVEIYGLTGEEIVLLDVNITELSAQKLRKFTCEKFTSCRTQSTS